ncbi:WPP domain-containing protein 1-like [Curcuma longa]|uniref:WPP domain-containing protein 1-like n=1 Tax=Curcuma longa TaxID=136217 RepID=UPI003D9EC705
MAESAAVADTRAGSESPSPAGFSGVPSLSLKIWPPTQRTRDAVIHRLVETLTTQSVLSKRYGLLSEEEANASALAIEEEAFSAASSAAAASSGADDDGIDVLHVYSREISRRVIESAKARAAASSVDPKS